MQRTLIVVALLLGSAGIVSSQPNKAANNEQAPSGQKHPAVHAFHAPDVQAKGEDDQTATRNNSPAGNTPIERPHWYTAPDWWLFIAAVMTAFVIGWQSNETRKSAKAALLQIQMMKDKERARVEIKPLRLELTRVSEDFWHLRATIELHNVGIGRAYVRAGKGDLLIGGAPIESPSGNELNVVNGFIDPIVSDPTIESFYFFQPEDAAISEYAQKICDGELGAYITGFIEYETVGTRFHRDFGYTWIGHGNPLNIGVMLTSSEEFAPKTDEDRVSFGFWSPSTWVTGWSGSNEEYEMKTEKTKKRRQNPN